MLHCSSLAALSVCLFRLFHIDSEFLIKLLCISLRYLPFTYNLVGACLNLKFVFFFPL